MRLLPAKGKQINLTAGKDRKGDFSMKKGKILVIGLIVLLMAGGLILAGCDDGGGCSDGGDCYYDPATEYGYTCGESSCGVTNLSRPKCNC